MSRDVIWWGKVNMKLDISRLPIRVVTSRAYHAPVMQNMLVPATPEELPEVKVDAIYDPQCWLFSLQPLH